jgi:hypothetical protein
MRRVGLLLTLLAPLAGGCQDYTTGVQTICNAPRDCRECQGVSAEHFDKTMATHISRSVRNEEARTLNEQLSNLDDPARAERLRKAADKAGLSACILADRLEARAEAWEAHQRGETPPPPPE